MPSSDPPRTIQDVIARLEAIIDEAIVGSGRIGYFAALYQRVTVSVRRALLAGNVFQDGPRMERLDVAFAGRFLEAWDQHRDGHSPSAPWRVALSFLDDPELLIVQHLGLAMNAHINLDLGIAAAEVMEGKVLDELEPDFDTINGILGRLIGIVQVQLAEVSPRFAGIERVAPVAENRIFGKVLDGLRDEAWALARALHEAPDAQRRRELVERRAEEVAGFGRDIAEPGFILDKAEDWIGAKESKDVRYNIQILGE
ncbi:MAG: hypothetical protein KC501_34170 [Myxococcales bacterium]|nr:hypothetical protein [Myxococcales bacterium]